MPSFAYLLSRLGSAASNSQIESFASRVTTARPMRTARSAGAARAPHDINPSQTTLKTGRRARQFTRSRPASSHGGCSCLRRA